MLKALFVTGRCLAGKQVCFLGKGDINLHWVFPETGIPTGPPGCRFQGTAWKAKMWALEPEAKDHPEAAWSGLNESFQSGHGSVSLCLCGGNDAS